MSLKIKKELSSTEQASNETVAENSWRYLFANPDRYICAQHEPIYMRYKRTCVYGVTESRHIRGTKLYRQQ